MSAVLREEFLSKALPLLNRRGFERATRQTFLRNGETHRDWVGFGIRIGTDFSVLPNFGIRIDRVHEEAIAMFGRKLAGSDPASATFTRSLSGLAGDDPRYESIDVEDSDGISSALALIESRLDKVEALLWSKSWDLESSLQQIRENCVLESALARSTAIWRLQGVGRAEILERVRQWLREVDREGPTIEAYLECLSEH